VKALIVLTVSLVSSILITGLFSLSLLATAGEIEVYHNWESITQNNGIAAYAKSGNRYISLSCRNKEKYRFFILANDIIHNPNTEVTAVFTISGNKYEMIGTVGKKGDTLHIKLPMGQNDIVDAMKRGTKLKVYIPVVSGVYPVDQTFSLYGFTRASQSVIEGCQ